MIIKENANANYLAHWKTKGSKNGLRRFQSYAVAPTHSGMVGEEVGEAAKQRARVERSSDITSDRKQKRIRADQEKLAAQKKEWAKSYKSLEKHADAFDNNELSDAMYRLDLMDKLKSRRIGQAEDLTYKGANTIKNISAGATAALGIYNALAAGLNAYNTYNETKKRPLPKAGWGDNNKKQKKG